MNQDAEHRVWALVVLCAALTAVLAFAMLASALAGLIGGGAPVWIGPSEAGTLVARLASHLSNPRVAWPASDRRASSRENVPR